jgi:hypothetical protein
LAVTSTIGGGAACMYTGNEQAMNVQRIKRDTSRRGCFIMISLRLAGSNLLEMVNVLFLALYGTGAMSAR